MAVVDPIASGLGSPDGRAYDLVTKIEEVIDSLNLLNSTLTTESAAALDVRVTDLEDLVPAVAGTIEASSLVSVGASKEVNEWTVTAGVLIQSKTSATADAGTVRGIHGQVTASHAAISAGSIAGVRGLATVSGVVSAGALYAYGAQGKLIVSGTMNHADARLAALLAQLDISAGTYTAGQISALWVDAGATSVSGALGGQFNMVRITNTTQSVPNAVIYAYSEGSFLLELDGPGGNAAWYDATAAGGLTRSHRLKVKVGGATGYISVFTD